MKDTNELFCKGQYLLSNGEWALAHLWAEARDNASDCLGHSNRFNHNGEFSQEYKQGALKSFAVLVNSCGDEKIVTRAEKLGFNL